MDIKSVDDIMQFIEICRKNRATQSTKMNNAENGHQGSSRSHAAMIIQLYSHELSSGEVTESTF
jgi:transketolase N-terminal domain/subunit